VKSLRFPIIGYVPAPGTSIAALRLGRREGEQLIYVGKAERGMAREALAAFEATLTKEPNRLGATIGAAMAAERLGDLANAR
jgi:hypothetical protein